MKKHFIELKSGAIIPVRDENVDLVNKHIEERKPIITKNNGTIMPFDIVDFSEREDVIEDASRAFGTPVYREVDGVMAVVAKPVKKFVTHREYASKYLAYQKIDNDDGGVWVAWRQPVHQITDEMVACTPEEAKKLR